MSHHDDEYDFDVYVAAELDGITHWFSGVLIPELEHRLGMRLYIRERDAMPGAYITDEITSAMDRSRSFLYIFDSGFVESDWFNYQLSNGISLAKDRKIPVVIIRYDDTPIERIGPAARAALRMYPCFKCSDASSSGRRPGVFWDGVKEALMRENYTPSLMGRLMYVLFN